ncbi:MAG: EpsI family protein [Candidatus Omnitrophica bacterium]|nr:EpsI family protein [Candidatus Omnitrophota bacterium]
MVYRNYFSIVFLLILTVIISWGFYFNDYHQKDTISIKNFPLSIDNWTSQELPIDKADLAVLETKNAFLRRYTDAWGRSVNLYIVYSQSNPKATNPPEVFYEENGVSIIDKGKKYLIIASSNLAFKVNWLLLDDNQNQQIAYYCFKVGGIYTHSYWKEQFLVALNNIIRKKAGNALIRISTDIVNGREKEATNLINEFASLIIPQLLKNLP